MCKAKKIPLKKVQVKYLQVINFKKFNTNPNNKTLLVLKQSLLKTK